MQLTTKGDKMPKSREELQRKLDETWARYMKLTGHGYKTVAEWREAECLFDEIKALRKEIDAARMP